MSDEPRSAAADETRRLLLLGAGRAGGALVALVLIVMGMSGAFRSKVAPGWLPAAAATLPDDVTTGTVRAESIVAVEEATGTVQAERRTTVSARILATIEEIPVRAGDEVRRGDVLIRLDAAELQARVEEAQRSVTAAEADHSRRQADLERARRLVRDGVLSRSEFDQTEAFARVAQAELERAREVLARARINVGYATITSPVAGKVVDRLADPGDTAVPGTPLLSLYDPSALRIEVPVRESLVAHLRLGDELAVRIGDRPDTIAATVDEIVPQAEPGSRTFLVKLGLPPYDDIFAGMFGRIFIPAGERQRVLVPGAAVERIGQLEFATVVGEDGTLTRRLVRLGRPTGDGDFEVLSGLRTGERVVLVPTATP